MIPGDKRAQQDKNAAEGFNKQHVSFPFAGPSTVTFINCPTSHSPLHITAAHWTQNLALTFTLYQDIIKIVSTGVKVCH